MNRGLLLKSLRETWASTGLFCVAFFIVEAALGFVLPTFERQFTRQLLDLPFVANIIRALVGAETSADIGPEVFRALPWVHPVPLAIVWAHAIIFCTRIPAGEVDRGTIDVLLGWPVSRWQVHISETAVWLASTAIFFLAGAAGNVVGARLAGQVTTFADTAPVVTNLLTLYLAVGALAWLLSSLSDRRGRAIGAAFLIVVSSFLLNYLAQLWAPLERAAFLSLMHYHRPIAAIREHAWPVRDLCILGGVALAAWPAAGWVFSRRDLATT